MQELAISVGLVIIVAIFTILVYISTTQAGQCASLVKNGLPTEATVDNVSLKENDRLKNRTVTTIQQANEIVLTITYAADNGKTYTKNLYAHYSNRSYLDALCIRRRAQAHCR